MKQYAIITGDLVASRTIKAEARENLYLAIDDFSKSLKRKWIDKYERFRGDSLQCSALQIKHALRVALLIRCFVMSYQTPQPKKDTSRKGYSQTEFDIRLSIGIGSVDFINEKKLSSSDGEAFVLSGQSLDSLKTAGERMILKTNDETMNREWDAIITLLDAVAQRWTQNGAEFILQKLLDKKDDEIAQLFGISLPAVSSRKKNAQWYAINKAIQYFEAKFSAW